ncbi:hypothetical protein [Coprobacter secundus]|uniref:hypothetical protein n=1 Tax=Coprobacter secundus TaxID=1501392 RepID=UPI003521A7AA
MDYLFNLMYKVLFGIIMFWFLSLGVSKCTRKEVVENPNKCHWKNIDPNRSPGDVISYDYKNRTVTYREPGEYKPKNNKKYKSNNSGVTLKSGNVSINTGLSDEEILEQLDLDYHDVRDYLGDELR